MLNPITIVPGDGPRLFVLLAGLHRFESAKLLGWDRVPATVVEHSGLMGELVEIDENLIRFELTTLERATATNRRKEIYEALHPETKERSPERQQARAKGQPGANLAPGFVEDTAAKTGRSQRAVERDAQIGAGLTDDEVGELDGTPAENNQVELLGIAKEKDAAKRREKIEAAKTPKPRRSKPKPQPPPREAEPEGEPEPPIRSLNPLDHAQHLWLERVPKGARPAVVELLVFLDGFPEFQRKAFLAWAKGDA